MVCVSSVMQTRLFPLLDMGNSRDGWMDDWMGCLTNTLDQEIWKRIEKQEQPLLISLTDSG